MLGVLVTFPHGCDQIPDKSYLRMKGSQSEGTVYHFRDAWQQGSKVTLCPQS